MSSYNHKYGAGDKTDAVLKFGKDLGWKVEESEFRNIFEAGGYQTADLVDEDAYPDPECKYRLLVEKPDANIEETYYWFLNFLRNDMHFSQIDKIYDVFSASESSAMWGNVGQRQSIQQEKAANYLRGIGELVRTLFQIVRELRILDERLEPYAKWKVNKSADITLKGIFASLVEGGGNNPDSIYSLAQKMGFTVLPDLFMNTHIYDVDDIDKEVDQGSAKEFNNVLRTVLKRKLFAYINWKTKTEREFKARRKFQLQYLRQHWNVIQLYMSWVKPYLRASKRLASRQSHIESAEFIGAFDTTRIEIEILAKRPLEMSKDNKHYGCVLATFSFVSKPKLSYKPEMQQQVVGHIGSCEITLRSYGWHEEDVKAYKKMRQEEDLELLKLADENVANAFEALKDELSKYLDEAEKLDPTERKKYEEEEAAKAAKAENELRKSKKTNFIEPFTSIFGGFSELGKSFFAKNEFKGDKNNSSEKKTGEEPDDGKRKDAATDASLRIWLTYNIYKKTHGLLNW